MITDIPFGRILHGERATTVGHQMNREILRLRPDVNCVIHLHHDEMIAFMAAGYEEIRSFSLTYGYLMQKPAHYLPASINVEEDVGPIKTFIQDTNCIIMKRHGFTVLGRSVSEAYHRTCVLVSEIKRNIIVETLCAANGKTPEYCHRRGDGLHGHARRRGDVSDVGQEDGLISGTCAKPHPAAASPSGRAAAGSRRPLRNRG